MFCSCESSLNSESDSSAGSDNYSSFHSIFLRNMKIVVTFNPQFKDVRKVEHVYTIDDHIASLWKQLAFSSSNDKEENVLEACSHAESPNMVTFGASYTSSFYFYSSTICEVVVHITFSSFAVEVLTVLNMPPS